MSVVSCFSFFFFNDTATTEIYTLSLHDALPILNGAGAGNLARQGDRPLGRRTPRRAARSRLHWALGRRVRRPRLGRSEEHTSELQSRQYLVCRLLLEKKKKLSSLDHLYDTVPFT